MALYRYEAFDGGGKSVRGTMDAGTPAEARANLRDKGFHATKLEIALASAQEVKSHGSVARPAMSWGQISGQKLDQLSVFSRQLSMLLKAGLPVAQALNVLTRQLHDSRFRVVIEDISVRVKEGASLDEALAVHPKYFPELYICIARAGAASGNLGALLNELAAYYTRQKRLRDRIVSALTYPALMCTIGFVILVFLMAFVVPKVTAVLLEQKRALPWPTEVLLTVSNGIQEFWWALLLIAVFLAWIISVLLRTDRGRTAFDRLMLSIPILGDLFCKQAIVRWADTMSNLLQSGIPVVQSLGIIKGALSNSVLAKDVDTLQQAIIEGKDLSAALKNSRVLPESIGFAVGVGEESGELAKVLRDIAESFNEEVEIVAGRLTDMVNPILIVFLGLIVGFIVAAILLPITDFSQVQ